MRDKRVKIMLTATILAILATAGFAQNTPPPADNSATQTGGQTQANPMRNMMDKMSQMKGENQSMSTTMAKMMQNMAAMQNEKDTTKMKAMMANQKAMMDQMQNQMMHQGNLMQNATGMMGNMNQTMLKACPMMAPADQNPAVDK